MISELGRMCLNIKRIWTSLITLPLKDRGRNSPSVRESIVTMKRVHNLLLLFSRDKNVILRCLFAKHFIWSRNPYYYLSYKVDSISPPRNTLSYIYLDMSLKIGNYCSLWHARLPSTWSRCYVDVHMPWVSSWWRRNQSKLGTQWTISHFAI